MASVLKKEYEIGKNMEHRHVLSHFKFLEPNGEEIGCVRSKDAIVKSGISYIISDVAIGGDFFEYINIKHSPFSNQAAKCIFTQLTSGIEYVHE
jgi:serine/threonine protein kinase